MPAIVSQPVAEPTAGKTGSQLQLYVVILMVRLLEARCAFPRSSPMFSLSVKMQPGKPSSTYKHSIQHLLMSDTVNETLDMVSALKESHLVEEKRQRIKRQSPLQQKPER